MLSATTPTEALPASTPVEAISTKSSPSFVWIQTSPLSSIQHQAELLEIRDTGYFVRWTLCNKEELIPLTCVLEQKLPRRRRRSSCQEVSAEEEAVVTECQNTNKEHLLSSSSSIKEDSALSTVLSASEQQQEEDEANPDLIASRNEPKKKNKKKKASKKKRSSSQAFSNNENLSKKMNRSSDEGIMSSVQTVPSLPSTFAVVTPQKLPIPPATATAASLSLWKIHKIPKAPAVARVAAILEPHGFDHHAADTTACLFLYAYERQSSWHRRNNESNPIWSKSPIFQSYSFCNVYRELDRGTTYLRSHVGDLYLKHCGSVGGVNNGQHVVETPTNNSNNQLQNYKKPLQKSKPLRRRDWIQQVLWASYCYRQVNRIEPFQNFGGIPTLEKASDFMDFVATIQEQEADKAHLFFNVHSYTSVPTFDDYLFHLERLGEANGWLLKSVAGRLAQCYTMQQCWDQISKRLPGLSNEEYGDEIAWQVLCDLLELGCLSIRPRDTGGAMDMSFVGPKPFRLLSLCLKDKELDQTRSLEFMKLLTDKQEDIFYALGVRFPAWDNRPLAVKDLIHCLGQFSKYTELQKDLCNQVVGASHRLLASRSFMDMSKNCRYCDIQTDNGLFCDACLCFYCNQCEKDCCAASPEHWVCKPCVDLDGIKFMD